MKWNDMASGDVMAGLSEGANARKPKSGKGSVLQARITEETRQALEAEAARTGRSLSQAAEVWLDDARKGRAGLHDLLGGLGVAEALIAMADFARTVEAQPDLGHPGKDLLARDALLAGWAAMLPRLLPLTPDTNEGVQVKLNRDALENACRTALHALFALPEDHPALQAAFEPRDKGKVLANVLYQRATAFGHTAPHSAGSLIAEVGLRDGAARMAVVDALDAELPQLMKVEGVPAAELEAVQDALAIYRVAFERYAMRRADAAKLGRSLAAAVSGTAPPDLAIPNSDD